MLNLVVQCWSHVSFPYDPVIGAARGDLEPSQVVEH